MGLILNLLAIFIGMVSVGMQLVSWYNFQFQISHRPRPLTAANQLSFFGAIVMLITLMVVIGNAPESFSGVSVVVLLAGLAEILASRLVDKALAEQSQAVRSEKAEVDRLRKQLRVIQRT